MEDLTTRLRNITAPTLYTNERNINFLDIFSINLTVYRRQRLGNMSYVPLGCISIFLPTSTLCIFLLRALICYSLVQFKQSNMIFIIAPCFEVETIGPCAQKVHENYFLCRVLNYIYTNIAAPAKNTCILLITPHIMNRIHNISIEGNCSMNAIIIKQ